MLPDTSERRKLLDAWWKLTGREDFPGTVHLPMLTGSMAPSIPPGSELAIVSARSRGCGTGDVVVFLRNDRLVAHRLLLCLGTGPRALCYEKGDLNASGSWIRRGNVLGLVVDRTPPEGAATTRLLAPSGIVLWSLRQGLRTRFHFWMRKDAADETEATNREEPDDG